MLEVELQIEDGKRKILERFQNIIETNYENNTTSERPIYDQARAVLNLQAEHSVPESFKSGEEGEEDHLMDDEDDEVICVD